MTDLKARIVRGGFAKTCSQAVNLALRLGSLMVLARLLEPADFGLVAMVTVLTGALNLFRDFGLSTATVQRPSITQEQLSMLFWVNLLVGAVLATVALVGAPLIAEFYREPRLRGITIAISAAFIFNALGVQHSAVMQRQMRFARLAAIDTGALILGVAVAIAAAVRGYGYWALVVMALVPPFVYTISVWIASAWIPGLPRRNAGVGPMLRFGGTVTLNSVVVYVAYNLEKVLLGRYWGAGTLGIYGRAYQLINLPIDSLNGAVGDIAVSALSRLQDDLARLKSYFLRGYSIVVSVTLPIMIACVVLADDLIIVVLGPKWSEVVPIFRLLAPATLVFALINPMWWLLASRGFVGRSLKVAMVLAPLVMASYVVGLPHGPEGVALAYSTVMALWLIPHVAWCIHGTGISLKDIFEAVKRPVIAAIVAGAFAAGVSALVPAASPPILRLLLGVAVLFLAFAGILLYVMGQKTFYLDLVRSLRPRSPQG